METPKHDPAAPVTAATHGDGHGNGNSHGNGSSTGNGSSNGSSHGPSATSAEQSAIDRDTTTRVRAALGALPDLIALRVGVDTRDGVVTLIRLVESRIQTEVAVIVAARVQGVKYVNDHLVARPRPRRRKDEPRTRRIEDLRGSGPGGPHE